MCVVSVVDDPGAGCMNLMPLIAVKTRRLVLYVACLIRICRVLSSSLGPTRCTRSISSTVKTFSPSRSEIPEILGEFLLEYGSISSVFSSRASTCFVRSEICLSLAMIIHRSSATSFRSSSTSSFFSFLPLSAHKEPQRGRMKSLWSTQSTPP